MNFKQYFFRTDVVFPAVQQAPRLAHLKLMKTSTGEKVEVIKALAPNWYDFGDHLDFDPTGEKLDQIKAECLHEGPTVCCRNMVTWQEHHSGVRGKVHFSFLCILRECGTVGIVRAG